jgi:hypothetical protein
LTEHKTGSFEDFKAYTLAVARGEQDVDPKAPKIWVEQMKDAGPEEGLNQQRLDTSVRP